MGRARHVDPCPVCYRGARPVACISMIVAILSDLQANCLLAGTKWGAPKQQIPRNDKWPQKKGPWEHWVPWIVDTFFTPCGYEVERYGAILAACSPHRPPQTYANTHIAPRRAALHARRIYLAVTSSSRSGSCTMPFSYSRRVRRPARRLES